MHRQRSNTEIEELVRERQLNLHMLGRWRTYLRDAKASGDPVFRLWHAATALPSDNFEKQWTSLIGRPEGSNSLVLSEMTGSPNHFVEGCRGTICGGACQIRLG